MMKQSDRYIGMDDNSVLYGQFSKETISPNADKSLELLREQLKENYENYPYPPFWASLFGFDSNEKFHKYHIEKIEAFRNAIEELEDFLTESDLSQLTDSDFKSQIEESKKLQLTENKKYKHNDSFFTESDFKAQLTKSAFTQEVDDHDYIHYAVLSSRVLVTSILKDITELKKYIDYMYQAIHKDVKKTK